MGAAASWGAPAVSAPPASAAQMAAIDTLAQAIYGLQRQMHHISSCLPGYGGHGGYDGYSGFAGASSSSPHPLYGMSGYGLPSSVPATAAVIVHTTAASQAVPITQIQFPSRRRPPNIHWLINLLY
jgi:hypothetical protein